MSRNIDKLKILKKSRELTVIVCRTVEHFDRKFKFTIGDRIVVLCEELRGNIIKANRATRADIAAGFVYDALTDLDQLEDKFRLAVLLNLMSIDRQAMLNEIIDDIRNNGRGWRKFFLQKCGVNGGVLPESGDEPDDSPSPESH